MKTNSKQVAIAYVPVLHKGYMQFVETLAERGIVDLNLVGDELLEAHEELDYLNRKDRLRAVPVEEMRKAITAVIGISVHELTKEVIEKLQEIAPKVITPREDIGKLLVEKYFANLEVEYIDIFLRWHRDNTGEEMAAAAHTAVPVTDFQKEVFTDVLNEAANATDWWLQVGAALVKNDEVLFVTHNEHMPEKEMPNILGDTRALFKRGINVNWVTSAHAEVVAIAEAAKRGIATEGAALFVTHFPCPYCARLIAKSGIKKLYFIKGYAVLEGDEFLKGEGVELIRVEV